MLYMSRNERPQRWHGGLREPQLKSTRGVRSVSAIQYLHHGGVVLACRDAANHYVPPLLCRRRWEGMILSEQALDGFDSGCIAHAAVPLQKDSRSLLLRALFQLQRSGRSKR